ncbi:MAG: exo-alpha-sialidase [Thermoleophilia bacterium]|nr:exo-alpha-sialidase [Thermoleophilia bacterium]
MRGRIAIVLLLAAMPTLAVAATRPTLLGTHRADVLLGGAGPDRVDARGGNDRIAIEYDAGPDTVACGAGRDVVTADLGDRVGGDCEVVGRRIHRDLHVDPDSQHESEVEPDSLTVGATTVSVFQVGRRRTGGSASIGFATSRDNGRTWRQGLLPGLTAATKPPGPAARASDPVIAYDAAHGVWLANALALAPGLTKLTIHRSGNAVTWGAPIDAAVATSENLAYDKNWLTCDNGQASPFRGRCYLAYTLLGRDDALAVQRSDDGGRTWSAASLLQLPVTGVIPVVQPDGKLVLTFWSGRSGMVSVVSTDGGVTLDGPVPISTLSQRDTRPFRAPPLITAELERGGGVLTAWQDCRFRPQCDGNDLVVSRSADGRAWSTPVRITTGRNVAIPTIGIEPGTGRLAIAYYVVQRNGIDAELVTSRDGRRWTAPQRLNARRMPLEWMPPTTPLGRMLADYIGVSWVRGRPLVILALASPPRGGKLAQAIYAVRG